MTKSLWFFVYRIRISITNHSSSNTVSVQVGSSEIMTFTKNYFTSPIVVITNLQYKKANSQDVELNLIGDTNSIYIVEYARSKNYEELISNELLTSNIYFGINDYTTTLIHAYIQVFDIDNSSKRIGYIESTFEVVLS